MTLVCGNINMLADPKDSKQCQFSIFTFRNPKLPISNVNSAFIYNLAYRHTIYWVSLMELYIIIGGGPVLISIHIDTPLYKMDVQKQGHIVYGEQQLSHTRS